MAETRAYWREATRRSRQREKEGAFDGYTYDPNEAYNRLTSQLARIRWHMTHPTGKWWTLKELSRVSNGSEASASARVRDLKKKRYGGFPIQSRRIVGGLWYYRVMQTEEQLNQYDLLGL